MDRALEKKKWNNKRILTLVGITGLVGLIAASFYFTSGKSKLNVEADRISIVEIKKDNFQEFIPINGTVLPIDNIYQTNYLAIHRQISQPNTISIHNQKISIHHFLF